MCLQPLEIEEYYEEDSLEGKTEDDPSSPRHIITVHKVGYKLVG